MLDKTLLELPINRDVAFSDVQGRHKPGLEKKQMKLLAKAAPLLRKVLEPDEEIHFVAPGATPYSTLEFLTAGWLIVYLKRCLLVVTDRRLLHIPARYSFEPKMSISQVRYGDVVEHKVGAFLGGKLKLTYRDNRKETFTAFPGWAAKKLKAMLPPRSGQGPASMVKGRQYLCPRCAAVLAQDSATCAGCSLPFKDKKTALKYSLLYPGGGYFYTGHSWLGIGDAITEGILILMVILGLVMTFDPEVGSDGLFVVVPFGILLAIEKAITVYHAQHFVAERLPADRRFSLS